MFPAIYVVMLALATALTVRRCRLGLQTISPKATIACFSVLLLGTLTEGRGGVAAGVLSAAIFTVGAWLLGLAANSLGQFTLTGAAPINHRRLFFRVAAAFVAMFTATLALAVAAGNLGSLTVGIRMQQAVIIGVVAIPIFEEVLFRGIPLGLINHWKLSGTWSAWVYYVGTSVCFSLCHSFSLHPFRTPQTIAIGLALALLYKKEGLLASAFAHILFNATSVVAALISK